MPPFSVFDTRSGAWQERKGAWIALGLRGEMGRSGVHKYGKTAVIVTHGNGWSGSAILAGRAEAPEKVQTEASVFDPVLCELAYRWFCPEGGQIVDPFAGGSVRGIVAGLLGFRYWGCDLSAVQVAANEEQRAEIAPEADIRWSIGDAMEQLQEAPEADFVFSCPPYGDLERYSDDPRDLSTMEYHAFLAAYKRIILRCSQRLRGGRLACFVVGDFRNRTTGAYRGFVADTINAFREVGMSLYNDAVLVTRYGSLPIRISAQFEGNRKLGKTHQNVLVFRKDD